MKKLMLLVLVVCLVASSSTIAFANVDKADYIPFEETVVRYVGHT